MVLVTYQRSSVMEYAFKKRLSDPIRMSRGGNRCPDIWELEDGNIIVIGEDITDKVENHLPSDVLLGAEERIVLIPRHVLVSTKKRIP